MEKMYFVIKETDGNLLGVVECSTIRELESKTMDVLLSQLCADDCSLENSIPDSVLKYDPIDVPIKYQIDNEEFETSLDLQRTTFFTVKQEPDQVYLLCGEYAVRDYFDNQNNLKNIDVKGWEGHTLAKMPKNKPNEMLDVISGYFDFTLIPESDYNQLQEILKPLEDATA